MTVYGNSCNKHILLLLNIHKQPEGYISGVLSFGFSDEKDFSSEKEQSEIVIH